MFDLWFFGWINWTRSSILRGSCCWASKTRCTSPNERYKRPIATSTWLGLSLFSRIATRLVIIVLGLLLVPHVSASSTCSGLSFLWVLWTGHVHGQKMSRSPRLPYKAEALLEQYDSVFMEERTYIYIDISFKQTWWREGLDFWKNCESCWPCHSVSRCF